MGRGGLQKFRKKIITHKIHSLRISDKDFDIFLEYYEISAEVDLYFQIFLDFWSVERRRHRVCRVSSQRATLTSELYLLIIDSNAS